MKALALVVCAVIAIAGITLFLRSRVAEPDVVRLADVPRVYDLLRQTGKDGAFAVFMFSDHGIPGESGQVNLQFSIENGAIGLDWVQLGAVNIRDAAKVSDEVRRLGFLPRMLEGNGVKYMRVEGGDLPRLCQRLMRDSYGVPDEEAIDLVPEGFSWQKVQHP